MASNIDMFWNSDFDSVGSAVDFDSVGSGFDLDVSGIDFTGLWTGALDPDVSGLDSVVLGLLKW